MVLDGWIYLFNCALNCWWSRLLRLYSSILMVTQAVAFVFIYLNGVRAVAFVFIYFNGGPGCGVCILIWSVPRAVACVFLYARFPGLWRLYSCMLGSPGCGVCIPVCSVPRAVASLFLYARFPGLWCLYSCMLGSPGCGVFIPVCSVPNLCLRQNILNYFLHKNKNKHFSIV